MADVHVRLQPRSRRDEVVGERDGALVVRVKAPPVDGKANDALVAFLAKRAQVPKRAVTLLHGHTSRDKLVRIEGRSEAEVRQLLSPPADG